MSTKRRTERSQRDMSRSEAFKAEVQSIMETMVLPQDRAVALVRSMNRYQEVGDASFA